MKELDRWATPRACVVAWLFAAGIWSSAAMSREVGYRAGQRGMSATVEVEPMTQAWLMVMNQVAKQKDRK